MLQCLQRNISNFVQSDTLLNIYIYTQQSSIFYFVTINIRIKFFSVERRKNFSRDESTSYDSPSLSTRSSSSPSRKNFIQRPRITCFLPFVPPLSFQAYNTNQEDRYFANTPGTPWKFTDFSNGRKSFEPHFDIPFPSLAREI